MGWVANATPRPLHLRERPVTHCTGGWVGLRSGLDRWGKSRPHRDSIPDCPALASRFSVYAISVPVYKLCRLNILANYIDNIRTVIPLDIFYISSSFSPRRLGFNALAVQVKFMVDELRLGQLLRHKKTFPVSI